MYVSFFKPLLDFIFALVLFPLVLLSIVVFGPIIFLTDRGPIFYNALRAGKDYKPFKMFKLRSMYLNAPDIRNEDGSTFNSDNDPRVMPIGKFLRKSSIDELPQILNVLIGDMSFIGPRPKLLSEDEKLESMPNDYRNSYIVKPGITGYAQAYYRNSISQDDKFHWDTYYAKNVSFILDVKILIKTILTVVKSENINAA